MLEEMMIYVGENWWKVLGCYEEVIKQWDEREPVKVFAPSMRSMWLDAESIICIVEGWDFGPFEKEGLI